MTAPEQTLEALVRDELREPVAELVRRLVPELVAEASLLRVGSAAQRQRSTRVRRATRTLKVERSNP